VRNAYVVAMRVMNFSYNKFGSIKD